jgi:hypothetical protein
VTNLIEIRRDDGTSDFIDINHVSWLRYTHGGESRASAYIHLVGLAGPIVLHGSQANEFLTIWRDVAGSRIRTVNPAAGV